MYQVRTSLACENLPFLLALRRWGSFARKEERGETDVFAGQNKPGTIQQKTFHYVTYSRITVRVKGGMSLRNGMWQACGMK